MKTEEDGTRYWEERDEVYAVNFRLADDKKTFCTVIDHGRIEKIDEYDAAHIVFSTERRCARKWAESTHLFPTEAEAKDFLERKKKRDEKQQ